MRPGIDCYVFAGGWSSSTWSAGCSVTLWKVPVHFEGLLIYFCGVCESRCLWSEFEFVTESVPRTRFKSILSWTLNFGVWKLSSPIVAFLADDFTERGDIGGFRFSLCCWMKWIELGCCSAVWSPGFPVDTSMVRLGASFTKFPSRYDLAYVWP